MIYIKCYDINDHRLETTQTMVTTNLSNHYMSATPINHNIISITTHTHTHTQRERDHHHHHHPR